MLNENSIADFKANLRGRLIEPGDKEYDEARKVHNAMIHKKPRLIARCNDVADVINSVNFARENNLLVSIRGGGHNAGGLGVCDDGLVIELSPINIRGSIQQHTRSLSEADAHGAMSTTRRTCLGSRRLAESFPLPVSAD